MNIAQRSKCACNYVRSPGIEKAQNPKHIFTAGFQDPWDVLRHITAHILMYIAYSHSWPSKVPKWFESDYYAPVAHSPLIRTDPYSLLIWKIFYQATYYFLFSWTYFPRCLLDQ